MLGQRLRRQRERRSHMLSRLAGVACRLHPRPLTAALHDASSHAISCCLSPGRGEELGLELVAGRDGADLFLHCKSLASGSLLPRH